MVKISHVQSAICDGSVANGINADNKGRTSLDPGNFDNVIDSESECPVKYSKRHRTDI